MPKLNFIWQIASSSFVEFIPQRDGWTNGQSRQLHCMAPHRMANPI